MTLDSYGPVTPAMVAHLLGTRPWVRLLSILGFVGTGFLLFAGVAMPFVVAGIAVAVMKS